jgi:hypothetical protein
VPTPRDLGIDLSDLSARLKQQWSDALKNNSNSGPGRGGADRSDSGGGGSDDRGGRKSFRQRMREMGFKTKGHPGRGGGENSGRRGGDNDD